MARHNGRHRVGCGHSPMIVLTACTCLLCESARLRLWRAELHRGAA